MLKAGIDVTLNPSRNTVFFENIYGDNPNDRKQRVLAKADPFTIQQLEHVEAKVFHLGSLLSDDFSPEVVAFLAKKGKVSIDVQGYLREVRDEKVYAIDWKDKLDVLKNTYYLKVNETEMETITGLKDPKEAAKLIHAWGVAEVIITLGSEGSLVYVDDTFYDIPAYPPHEVVDATGCGDTYSAGYLYKRLQGANPVEAKQVCGSHVYHQTGAQRTIQPHHRRCNENHQITDGAIPTLKRKAVSYMQETAFFFEFTLLLASENMLFSNFFHIWTIMNLYNTTFFHTFAE